MSNVGLPEVFFVFEIFLFLLISLAAGIWVYRGAVARGLSKSNGVVWGLMAGFVMILALPA